MTLMNIIAKALQGDDDALRQLGEIHPPAVGVVERTRDRLKAMPAACAAAVVGVTDPVEAERLIRIEIEKATIELAPFDRPS